MAFASVSCVSDFNFPNHGNFVLFGIAAIVQMRGSRHHREALVRIAEATVASLHLIAFEDAMRALIVRGS